MSKHSKKINGDTIDNIMLVATIATLMSLFGCCIYDKTDFNNRVASHTCSEAKHNRWHDDEMAANVAALQDSTLSADFNHYRDISDYFVGALLKYSVEKKPYELAVSPKSDFPRAYADVKQERRFLGIRYKRNGEILDSLDNCVKQLDARYDYLTQQRKSNQR